MPKINYLNGQVVDAEIKRADLLIFKVPVDDENHIHFEVRSIPSRVLTLRGGGGERRKRKLSIRDLVREVLAGRLHLNDIDPDRTDFVMVEDEIAQTGQGKIPDRVNEHLGRSDTGVILLRKIWERELARFGRTAYQEMDLPAGDVSYLSGIITVHTPPFGPPPPARKISLRATHLFKNLSPCIHLLRERGERPTDALGLFKHLTSPSSSYVRRSLAVAHKFFKNASLFFLFCTFTYTGFPTQKSLAGGSISLAEIPFNLAKLKGFLTARKAWT